MKRFSLLIALLFLVGCTTTNSIPVHGENGNSRPTQEPGNSADTSSSLPEPASSVAELCRSAGQRTPEMQQRFIAHVNEVIQQSKSPSDIQSRLSTGTGPDSMDVRQADVDGDGSDDLLLAWAECDLPVMVYRHAAPGQPVLLPPGYVGGGPQARNRIDQVGDVNGDGQVEIVAVHVQPGGSADIVATYIWQWREGRIATLFRAHLSNWRGPNRWTVGVGLVTIQCRPMGPFQHKLSPHRQLSEVYGWDQALGVYTLVDRTWDPVAFQLQQIDAAERMFYAGHYEEALHAYQEVAHYASDRMDAVPWVSFSQWRIAEIDALRGQKEEAVAALERGTNEPPPLGEMAKVFLNAYEQTDAAAGFAAVWRYLENQAGQDEWPYLFDKSSIMARPVLEDAFRRAGQTLPAGLPEAPKLDPADCMASHS